MAEASIIVSGNGLPFKVFVNPDQFQLQEIGEVIRFVADNGTRTLYVWNYNAGSHDDVSSGLNLKERFNSINFLGGSAKRRSDGSYVMRDSDFLKSFVARWTLSDERFLSRLLSQDWSWVDQYIRVTEWLRGLKEALLPKLSY
jgi:hypothetical protein